MRTTQDQKVKLEEAGEHLVVSRLLANGYVAGRLPRTYKANHIYVEHGMEVVHIQVKTRIGARSWPVGTAVVADSPLRFYAFVLFPSLEPPDVDAPVVYVVPSATVRHAIEVEGKLYFATRPRQVEPGVPNIADPFRSKGIAEHGYGPGWLEQYRENWKLLEAP